MKRRSRSSAAALVVSERLRPGLRVNCRLWVFAPGVAGVFGEGKVRLLRAVAEQGSLHKAAASMGMSYRKAWADVRKAEECLGIELLVRRRGGTAGGSSELTGAARTLLQTYDGFRRQVVERIEEALTDFVDGTNAGLGSAKTPVDART